jgi:hypothetical protein
MQPAEVETVTVTAEPAPAPAGDAKLYNAGKASIAKAGTVAELQGVVTRIEKRREQLSAEQHEDLLRLVVEREAALTPTEEESAFD